MAMGTIIPAAFRTAGFAMSFLKRSGTEACLLRAGTRLFVHLERSISNIGKSPCVKWFGINSRAV